MLPTSHIGEKKIMPWKLTVIFPDSHKPFCGAIVQLGHAMSQELVFLDDNGKPAIPPPPPPSRMSRDVDSHQRAIESAGRRFPPNNRAPVANPEVPPPPPTDPILADSDAVGYSSYDRGVPRDSNPYADPEDPRYRAWEAGWDRAAYGDDGSDDDRRI